MEENSKTTKFTVMGFLSKLFGRNQYDKSLPDLAFYNTVVDRIVVSDTLRRNLKDELKHAFEDPKSFYDDNNDYILSERGLMYPEDRFLTPKFVLIDTLQGNGEMAEVDWKEEESEIRTFVKEIRMAKGYDFTISDDDLYEGNDTGEILKIIGERELNPQGYSIELLDIDSDSYVFTIVSINDNAEVKMMFERLKKSHA